MSVIWPISIITCLALLLCIGGWVCSGYILLILKLFSQLHPHTFRFRQTMSPIHTSETSFRLPPVQHHNQHNQSKPPSTGASSNKQKRYRKGKRSTKITQTSVIDEERRGTRWKIWIWIWHEHRGVLLKLICCFLHGWHNRSMLSHEVGFVLKQQLTHTHCMDDTFHYSTP